MVASSSSPQGSESPAPSPVRASTPVRTHATLLLVEDDPQVRDFIRMVLRTHGYHVLAADTAEQAMALWERHQAHIHLVITDLMIPTRATGAQLARQFQGDRPLVKVLFISGFGREISAEDTQFMKKGHLLPKPFTPDELLERVGALLRQDPVDEGDARPPGCSSPATTDPGPEATVTHPPI
jgi:two-component system, cell cycle sensor histidine kinase and response regulator CckA